MMKVIIEKAENGFILKEVGYIGQTRIFKTFEELVHWIGLIYEWK